MCASLSGTKSLGTSARFLRTKSARVWPGGIRGGANIRTKDVISRRGYFAFLTILKTKNTRGINTGA